MARSSQGSKSICQKWRRINTGECGKNSHGYEEINPTWKYYAISHAAFLSLTFAWGSTENIALLRFEILTVFRLHRQYRTFQLQWKFSYCISYLWISFRLEENLPDNQFTVWNNIPAQVLLLLFTCSIYFGYSVSSPLLSRHLFPYVTRFTLLYF